MKQREFIQSGIKLIGFWLLVTGLLSLISGVGQCAIYLNAIRHNPRVSISGLFGGSLSGGTTEEIMSDSQMLMQWTQAQWRMIYAFLEVIFALYLCRGGAAIVRFLVPRTDEGPNKASKATSEPAPSADSSSPQG